MEKREYGSLQKEPEEGLRPLFILDPRGPQMPEIPWDQYMHKVSSKLAHLYETATQQESIEELEYPHLPEYYKCLKSEIYAPELSIITENNARFRSILGSNCDGIFYRPGIGDGDALIEILEKMGTYNTMVVTDPIYEGIEMANEYRALLPTDYYIRVLSMLDAQNIEVTLSQDYTQEGVIITPDKYQRAEIPAGGKATITCVINGVNLTYHLLMEDMTKFSPTNVSILGFGRPTPHDQGKTGNPHSDTAFQLRTLRDLTLGGIVEFNKSDFIYLPKYLPPQVLGITVLHNENGNIIAQKTSDKGPLLDSAFSTERDITEALGALAGKIPMVGYSMYIKDASFEDHIVTLDDVLGSYKERMARIADFTKGLTPDDAEKVLQRIEILFMHPISTRGSLDLEKVQKIRSVSSDPDNPTEYMNNYYDPPYFGSPRDLINDHNNGEIDAIEYYKRLIFEFYQAFPQLKGKY